MTCAQRTGEAFVYSGEVVQILRRTSLINGKLLNPWIDAAHAEEPSTMYPIDSLTRMALFNCH